MQYYSTGISSQWMQPHRKAGNNREAWQVPVYEHYLHWKNTSECLFPSEAFICCIFSHLEALHDDWSGLCNKRPLIDMVMCMTVLKLAGQLLLSHT